MRNRTEDKDKRVAKLSADEQFAIFSKQFFKLVIIESVLMPLCIAGAVCSVYFVPDKYFIYAMVGVFILMLAVCYVAGDIIKLKAKRKLLKSQGIGKKDKEDGFEIADHDMNETEEY